MDYETHYYTQKTLIRLQSEHINDLKKELDYYQQNKWYEFLNWLYKREMIGWVLASVIGFSWFMVWIVKYIG